MISIEKCREILGENAEGLSDEKIVEIRDSLYQLAEIAIDGYIGDAKHNKEPRREC